MESFFPEELIEEIKSCNDITDVISQYIQVKQIGSSYKGLCPFHNEKTPSFIINKDKQIYKCFGCGEGGDVIRFIMKMENIDFIEAIKLLADRANITLENNISSQEAKKEKEQRNIYFEINRKAGRYFFYNLIKKPNPGLGYLKKRGLAFETIRNFGLGFAMNQWTDLVDYLKKEGYRTQDIEACGLIKESEKYGSYDYFRNRIMFPIFDIRGNVVGFGGRVLDHTQPKYLNSPETKIFNKGHILYGLNFARKDSDRHQMIVVEGYMDVIALHHAGFKNTVAALGTSLTKYHGQILKKYCDEVIICFDGDTAGIKATMRSINILKEVGCQFRILILPDGKDPDDYIKIYGDAAFQKQIEKSLSLIDYKMLLARKKYALTSVEEKVQLAKELALIIREVESPIEREVYIERVEKETGIPKNAIKAEVYDQNKRINIDKGNKKYSSYYKRDNKYIEMVPMMEQKGHIIAEKQLIKFMILNPAIVPNILSQIEIEDFSSGKHQIIVEYLSHYFSSFSDSDQLLNIFPDLKTEIEDILSTDIDHIDLNKTLEKYIINMKKYKLLYEVKELEKKQSEIVNSPNLNKEEVESQLLELGMEIMKKNAQIQRLQA